MSVTIISASAVLSDLQTFHPIAERVYGSSQRLVSHQGGLTNDISTLLGCALSHETFVDVVRDAVTRQLERWGCGGRTVAVWVYSFYQCISELFELGIDVGTINAMMEIAIFRCVKKSEEISMPISDILFVDLCDKLSHGIPDWRLLPDSLANGQLCLKSGDVSPTIVHDTVKVQFERSADSSRVVSGLLVKSSESITGLKKVVLVAADIMQRSPHVGYKGIVKETSVKSADSVSSESVHKAWEENLVKFLTRLGVQVVLSTGICKHDFINTGICVMPGIDYDTLDALAKKHNLDLLPLVEFATPQDICYLKFEKFSDHFVSVNFDAEDNYLTLLIRKPVRCSIANRYKSFVSRLSLALKSQSVVPGGGKTEHFCANLLRNVTISEDEIVRYGLTPNPDTHVWYSMVTQKLSDVFLHVAALAERNIESSNDHFDNFEDDYYDFLDGDSANREQAPKEGLFDEISSKLGAWKTALEAATVLSSVSLTFLPKSLD